MDDMDLLLGNSRGTKFRARSSKFTLPRDDNLMVLYLSPTPRKTMIVSGWSNSTPNNRTGAGYGIRIKFCDRDRYFQRSWGSVDVVLDDGEIARASLPEKFWTTCPELKSSVIGRWMLRQGVVPWVKGKPPRSNLEPIGDRRFRLAQN
jgi:hypothetical protein